MMPALPEIYDRGFFEEWGKGNKKYVESAETIADIIFKRFRPKRLVDLGAGCNVYGHRFATHGVDVLALDGVVPPKEHSFPIMSVVRDLTVPFDNIFGRFDLAVCFEVAEHIPESLSDVFLSNILQFSDRLLLSAAQPNQGGHHHVNERPKRYWVARLAEKGFAYNRPETGRLLTELTAARPPFMWMVEQISVYDRGSGARDRLPFSVQPPP